MKYDQELDLKQIQRIEKQLAQHSFDYANVHAHVRDGHLLITFPTSTFPLTHVVLYKNKRIRWARKLTATERKEKMLSEDFGTLILPHGCERARRSYFVFVSIRDESDDLVGFRLVYDEPVAAYPDDNSASCLGVLPAPSIDARTDSQKELAIYPYLSVKKHALGVLLCRRDEWLRMFKYAILENISFKRGGRICLDLKLRAGAYMPVHVELSYRSTQQDLCYTIPIVTKQKGPWLFFSVSFDVCNVGFKELYWDVYVVVDRKGKRYRLVAQIEKACLYVMQRKFQRAKLDNGLIVLPHASTQLRRLAFICRRVSRFDSYSLRLKECVAWALYKCMGMRWKEKSIWLVYEKFSSLAEDNGFYFFKYCMDELDASENKNIYYVMDKKAPEYAKLAPYKHHVVKFMSTRHLFYLLTASIYVGSDVGIHLFQWRCMPSSIYDRVNKHACFFLQHGVIALKRVDEGFSIDGLNPVTYFLTSSQAEQQIILENFGYSEQQVPVLGLSRWDVLEDRSNDSEPMILVMPTWRPWLEGHSLDTFTSSMYFKAYSSLLNSARLDALLERHNATLLFFIHPKMAEFISAFEITSPRVQLYSLGQRQLNDLIMTCSMLITDYSSVCWDVLYMDKPVLFFQFDQDEFLANVGSYIDFETDLPGDRCKTADEVIDKLAQSMDSGFVLCDENRLKAAKWYAHKHENNREDTYKFIRKQGY